jgi:Rad3-related DNA helicase
MFVNKISLLVDHGFILASQQYQGSNLFFLELFCVEPYLILNKILDNTRYAFIGSSIGNIKIFESLLKITFNEKYTYVDDETENIYLTNVSSTNSKNNSFYGEIIRKLCRNVPDGIICYFSSISLMEYYIKKWNEQDVINSIMNDKLLFIEEQDPIKLTHILVNYKKACDLGRGALLFLSTRNRAALNDIFTDHQSRCIVFIGFPIETKLTKKFEFKLENIKKQFNLDNKEYLNFDTFKLFSTKISEKINNIFDKKVLVILDEKLMSDKLKDYLPEWLKKIMHVDYDKENINTDERLKNIKKFLDN